MQITPYCVGFDKSFGCIGFINSGHVYCHANHSLWSAAQLGPHEDLLRPSACNRPVYISYIVGFGLPVGLVPAGPFAPLDRHWKGWMRRHRRCSWPRPSYRPGGGAVDCIGGAAVLSFCDGPWRIRVLAGSGEFFCPSLAFSGDGTAGGAMSGEDSGRLSYHFLEESGE